MFFKFQVNRIKIVDFRNLFSVDLLVYVDILVYGYRKTNRWLNSAANGLQISSQSDEN